jgi:hypothetical protein
MTVAPIQYSITVIANGNLLDTLDAAANVCEEVLAERVRQEGKFGDQSGRNPVEWGLILGEEYGEVIQEVNNMYFLNADEENAGEKAMEYLRNYRTELIQVAAVAIAAVAALDKQQNG